MSVAKPGAFACRVLLIAALSSGCSSGSHDCETAGCEDGVSANVAVPPSAAPYAIEVCRNGDCGSVTAEFASSDFAGSRPPVRSDGAKPNAAAGSDSAGHLAGDQALSAMGKVLRQATRENDVVGRYGGDEFAIVLPHTPPDGAERVGRRVLELLDDKGVTAPDGERLALRSSIGSTTLAAHGFSQKDLGQRVEPSYFHDVAQALIGQADEAPYRAKKLGGGALCPGAPTLWLPLLT